MNLLPNVGQASIGLPISVDRCQTSSVNCRRLDLSPESEGPSRSEEDPGSENLVKIDVDQVFNVGKYWAVPELSFHDIS